MLHLCNTFAVSLLHHLYCGILSVFDILAFCPDTVITHNNVLMYNSVLINTNLIYVMQCVHCTLYKLYSLYTVHCPVSVYAQCTLSKSRFSTVYIVHCIVKWTICTLYVEQIVQSIIYPCPCTLNKYSLCTMYIVHSTMSRVLSVKFVLTTGCTVMRHKYSAVAHSLFLSN